MMDHPIDLKNSNDKQDLNILDQYFKFHKINKLIISTNWISTTLIYLSCIIALLMEDT